jgi:Beta-galactosidase/beta-glucuronidase
MNRFNTLLILCFVACLSLYSTAANAYESIALDGTWRFDIDKSAKGVGEGWEKGHQYTLTINLPGTMDQANFGTNPPKADINNQYTFGWSRPKIYEGVAWYEREVEIPAAWAGKRVELFLEQLRSESTVWIDGKKISPTEESLLTSHRHDLTQLLTPGKHRLTIMLDNSNKRGIGGSYIRSSMGQGNWQGIVGDIELRASDKVWIEHVRFETRDERRGEITVTLGNTSGNTAKAKGEVRFSDGGEIVAKSSFTADVSPSGGTQKVNIDISKLECWSQFVPQLYDLEVEMQAGSNSDKYSERTGVRTVGRNTNNQFMVNGTTTFLRGTVCYNIFPITGYPSTELDDWLKIFRTYQEWGMNHVRFHSLTPPKAAFQAADILGIYLQSECPKAGIVGKVAEDDAFQIAEGHRILRDYGNHPSFILMSMGNELAGEKASISRVFNEVSSADNRRLYTTTTGGASLEYKDDFKIYGGIVRGFKGPQTDWDYKAVIEPMGVTVISHEVGQWHVYPDVSIIPKFTGVMKADNLQYIHDDLKERSMLDMAHDFTQVTGAFALQLYKEEMEAITRTPNFGGFQILMLNDFPAQGTATCGMIDIFNDLKGYALPHQFREFVAPIVPLARMPKRVYTSSETFTARVDLANYTQSAIRNGKLLWTLQDGEKSFTGAKLRRQSFR